MNENKKKWSLGRKLVLAVVILAVLVVAGVGGLLLGGKYFTGQETKVRDTWAVDTGELLNYDSELNMDVHEAKLEASVKVIQLVPGEIEEDGFTYYDVAVQQRLQEMLAKTIAMGQWTPEAPLVALNPYGTGSNGLYVYFETQRACSVSYTIHVEDEAIPDYTAVVPNDGENGNSKVQEFQIVGLVPGETNEVTLALTGAWGNEYKKVTFEVTMPETASGYPTVLEYTDGESAQPLSDGLYALTRVNGTLGYVFFFDNAGVLRYEMVLEGYGADRFLEYEGDILTSVSSNKLACINGLGQVTRVYELGQYDMHHDFCFGQEGTLLVLAEEEGRLDVDVEDLVLEVDLVSGQVDLLIDFTQLMNDYYVNFTRKIRADDPFFWQVGERDWIHINSIAWMEADDSVVLSSREQSTILKVKAIHEAPEVTYLLGDARFWEGTGYENLCYAQAGEAFMPQYGQHNVEVSYDDELPEGCYYLTFYNNNYWTISSRQDEYQPAELDPGVGVGLYDDGDDLSYVYTYLVDENAKTYALADSYAVPYSSIVSNADEQANGNEVVNSGVANVFGEYDAEGNLIREFKYTCTLQNYRVFKETFAGIWSAAE